VKTLEPPEGGTREPGRSWPRSSPRDAFTARRKRLQARLDRPVWLASGLPRPRNFAGNPYPFRAESHFLYLAGCPTPAAVLRLDPDNATLYLTPPDPALELWEGPQRSLTAWSQDLQLEVRPLAHLRREPESATLPPTDLASCRWLGDLMGRSVGPRLSAADLALADALIELRLEHDSAAVDQIRQAITVTTEAHLAGMRRSAPGRFESEIRAAMDERIVAHGMTHAYSPIVTVTGEVLHDERHHRRLATNSLVLADVGAETPEGWASDVTRTWPANGIFSPTQRELYEVVLRTQRAALDQVRPGVRFRDVHHAARQTLVACLLDLGILQGTLDDLHELGASALFFPHGVGHLLGLDVHDMEDLGDRAGYGAERTRTSDLADQFLRLDRTLAPGMIVTIEPGFYRVERLFRGDPAVAAAVNERVLAQFDDVRGIRIEDDVLVTNEGCEVLSAMIPKNPSEVEASCRGESGLLAHGSS
jgi:Xaa-Pro aminopeptidase